MAEFGPKRDDIRMRVIVGGAQFTPQWGIEQLRAEWKRLGGQEVERKVNEWYQANKESFGK